MQPVLAQPSLPQALGQESKLQEMTGSGLFLFLFSSSKAEALFAGSITGLVVSMNPSLR